MRATHASLPVRGAWIEIFVHLSDLREGVSSLPVRGAWIEIDIVVGGSGSDDVAPCEGSVD